MEYCSLNQRNQKGVTSIRKFYVREDLSGIKFDRLTVVEPDEEKSREHKKVHYRCICDCGKEVSVRADGLKSGNNRSCGCLQLEKATKHNMHNTRFYREWRAMIGRCKYSNSTSGKYYVGRDISYDEKWNNFNEFYNDMFSTYRDDLTLDRLDNDLGYSKDNCRWATNQEQQRNKRNSLIVNYKGEKVNLKDLLDSLGIGNKYQTIYTRLSRGWSVEKSIDKELA